MKKHTLIRFLAAVAATVATTAALAAPTGVTINGFALDDAVSTNGPGWTYASPTLTLTNAGPFTLSGANTASKVNVVVPENVTNTVTLSNLTLTGTAWGQRAFAMEAGANVSLLLAGKNVLVSTESGAGLRVPTGASLSITNAPGDTAGSLTATGGGNGGAGIGGDSYGTCGTVTIDGGTVVATSNWGGAGIGGGYGVAGGTVTINGGTVTATSRYRGAGIGGGGGRYANGGAGGTTTINGGTVTATGGTEAAGIGGGSSYSSSAGAGGTTTITGGTVFAQGNSGGADIGPGRAAAAIGPNTFTGGSIRLANNRIAPAPSDGASRVWCVTVTNLVPNAPVAVSNLDPYGVNDLFADENGKLHLWLPDAAYAFLAGGASYEATVAGAPATALPLSANPYITVFSGTNPFTVRPQAASWNGTLQYATDVSVWEDLTTGGAAAADGGSGTYRLYLRGSGNDRITGGSTPGWAIDADGGMVACSGDIGTLLDHVEVSGGGHPAMAADCFANLFQDCAALAVAPALPATNLAAGCYQSMFAGCTGLTQAPALPATAVADRCYQSMFAGCTGLAEVPALPATNLADNCYQSMFAGCTGLARLPALPATTLAPSCYNSMFQGCTGIELNAAGPGTRWAIPACATPATGWNTGMFAGTGGTFQGAPEVGATYYLDAPGYPERPDFAADGTAIVVVIGAFSVAIANAQGGVWYALLAADDPGEANWEVVGRIYATKPGPLVFTMPRDPEVPRRFFKVGAGLVMP
jgi:hypothetical protein